MKLISSGIYAVGKNAIVNMRKFCLLILIALLICSCKSVEEESTPVLFEALGEERTGIRFSNDLHHDQKFNLFKYIYFYNGSGIGAADFNNDGKIDLFFGSNQGRNKLFLNKGGLQFDDVTTKALIPDDGGWTTGISVIDINDDGWMDIYVCRVGNYETLKSHNLLLINQGLNADSIPVFKEMAAEYGLDFSGFSTQAAFFDYDLDGDLDMFLLNHSVHENGTFRPRIDFKGTYHPLSGDRFYKNENGRFVDFTRESGIHSSAIGYGLGIAVSDINLDGFPDIYIGNDFHENDYLYINKGDGTFSDRGADVLQHTSQFSMGVDVADVNNDARPEIISTDMLPEDAVILKRSLGEDAYDIFQHKISVGYSYQYTRNNLQWNRPDGKFSELGLYSGIAASDWSWAPLWMDFDNDGWKDLFIANGIPKRMNDIDYVNFVSNTEIRQSINDNVVKDKDIELIKKFPEIKLPNKFYHNQGNLHFKDAGTAIKGAVPGFSNGAIYADLDSDGDLDIVVNNIDAPVVLYENKHQHAGNGLGALEIRLTGPAGNLNAIGVRVLLMTGNEKRWYEKYPARGFLSSMETSILIGMENTRPDSLLLIWPDNTCEPISIPADSTYHQQIHLRYKKGLRLFDAAKLSAVFNSSLPDWEELTGTGLQFEHRENHFVEFDREPLIPHMLSTEGPALAIGDINGDGWDDIFVGGARNQRPGLFIQDEKGKFIRKNSAVLDEDSIYEDVDAVWADMNGDRIPDLLVASAGNEFYGKDRHNTPRLYINDGKGNLTRKENAFAELFLTASSIAVTDLDGDGINDVFIGARAVPWEYGLIPESYLLKNDGTGRFTVVTEQWSPELSKAGFVTDAIWIDLDGDGDEDLLMTLEWGPITAWIREGNQFLKKELGTEKGWWNFIMPFDVDGDGDLDLVAGNLGWNSRLSATEQEPVRLYYNDFDNNGKNEQVMTYYLQGKELPFASKAELERQMPQLKKKFLYAEQFAKASLEELLGREALKSAFRLEADYFSNAILINQGNLSYKTIALPWQNQLSPLRAGLSIAEAGAWKRQVVLFGNYYDNNIQMGRYDADFGSSLNWMPGDSIQWNALQGWMPDGQVRKVESIQTAKGQAWILARNNGRLSLIRTKP